MFGKQHFCAQTLHPQCYRPTHPTIIYNSIIQGLPITSILLPLTFYYSAIHSTWNMCAIWIRLQWQLLLEPSIPNLASSSSYARAFQLLLERKRLSTFGITSYELHKKSGRMIFPASSSLFQCLDTGYNVSTTDMAHWIWLIYPPTKQNTTDKYFHNFSFGSRARYIRQN